MWVIFFFGVGWVFRGFLLTNGFFLGFFWVFSKVHPKKAQNRGQIEIPPSAGNFFTWENKFSQHIFSRFDFFSEKSQKIFFSDCSRFFFHFEKKTFLKKKYEDRSEIFQRFQKSYLEEPKMSGNVSKLNFTVFS